MFSLYELFHRKDNHCTHGPIAIIKYVVDCAWFKSPGEGLPDSHSNLHIQTDHVFFGNVTNTV